MQPIQIEIDDGAILIATGDYRGDDCGRLEKDAHGWCVFDWRDDKPDFYCADLGTAITWAIGNAYRYVAHRSKNG